MSDEKTTNLGDLLARRLAGRPPVPTSGPVWLDAFRRPATESVAETQAKLAAAITRARERAQAAEARIAVALQLIDDALSGFRPSPSLQALKRALLEDYPPSVEQQATLSFPHDDQGRPV